MSATLLLSTGHKFKFPTRHTSPRLMFKKNKIPRKRKILSLFFLKNWGSGVTTFEERGHIWPSTHQDLPDSVILISVLSNKRAEMLNLSMLQHPKILKPLPDFSMILIFFPLNITQARCVTFYSFMRNIKLHGSTSKVDIKQRQRLSRENNFLSSLCLSLLNCIPGFIFGKDIA